MKNKLIRPTLAAVLLASFACALSLRAAVNDVVCATNWCEVVQWPSGSISYTNVEVSPGTNMCLGGWVSAWPYPAYTSSACIWKSVWAPASTNCPTVFTTNEYCYPFFITNWWVLSYPGYSTNGEGSYMSFQPTNCGEGSITFYGTWRNSDPCTGQFVGGGTISRGSNFKVINVEVAPASTNALINKCQEADRSVTFCLTNSCYPGGVTWSISPTLTNGATISGSGGCVSVTIGDAVQDYTMTATSNDNTNCSSSATLSVAQDCVCTNHIIAANPEIIPGFNCATNDAWGPNTRTTSCGDSVVLRCIGYVRLELNGALVGHCPYPSSSWIDFVWPCKCDAVIMRTQFSVVDTGPSDPAYTHGKHEIWTCAGGLCRMTWTVPPPPSLTGVKTPRAPDAYDRAQLSGPLVC